MFVNVYFDERAKKEYRKLPKQAKKALGKIIAKLGKEGHLYMPMAKKLVGYDMYEMRVRVNSNAYRGFYFYQTKDTVLILHFMQKKSQKTPRETIKLVVKRQKYYL